MGETVRLTDSDIRTIVGRCVSGQRYIDLARTVLEIALREKGSTVRIDVLADVLNNTPFLSDSVVQRIVRDFEKLHDEQAAS